MKAVKTAGICLLAVTFFWVGTLFADRKNLNDGLIRLHVIANSDTTRDQEIKLKVRDAILENLSGAMNQMKDMDAAKEYLAETLPKLHTVANQVLRAAGVEYEAVVSMDRAAFDTRYYDSFTLPAGVYNALRITLGDGKGKNWWCVAFPELCYAASSEEVAHVAAGAGFSNALGNAITETENYEIRFLLLDTMGRIKNFLFSE